jgi:uncharacterized protein (TIGR03089 family)
MNMHPTAPRAVLAALVAADPGRPRVTYYDDTRGPTGGERIELSARVLANWVAKAANLLQDDLDAGPGTIVRLDLPPHWRTLYWALGVWTVGATVELSDPLRDHGARADILVTDDPVRHRPADAHRLVVVTLAALARRAPGALPPGAIDEARDLAGHGDVVEPWDEPEPGDPALVAGGATTSYAQLIPVPRQPERVYTATTDTADFLRTALEVYASGGSLVLSRGGLDPGVPTARLASEGVTRTADPSP